MKKLLFATFLTATATAAFSQGNINKGDWMLGGNISIASSKYEDIDESQTTSISISPDAGYFFMNQLAGGLRFSFSSEKVKDMDAESQILAAPFLRYYFLSPAQKVNVFLDASYGFGSAKFNTLTGSTTESVNNFGVAAGAAVFFTPSTALEFALGYNSTGGDAIGDNRFNAIGFNIGFQVHLPGRGGAAK